jgi:predicted metalloprotease with PDZ domain
VAGERLSVLAAVAHEFFHGWNVERIRPRSLEPFNLEDVNMSGELWLAEGFTNYYGALLLHRAGLAKLSDTAAGWGARSIR